MKKVVLILAILFLLAVVGLAVFIATFDADRFRPQVVSQLQASLGKPVRLERITLGWQHGIAVQFRGFAMESGDVSLSEPLIQVESASALVRLAPLLQRRLEIASVVLTRPRILLARDADGRLSLLGLAAAVSPAAASRTTTADSESAISFNVESLRIDEGTVHWLDATTQPPTERWLRRVEMAVTNISPGQPMDVELRGALEADVPNFRARGRVTIPSPTQAGSVEQFELALERLSVEQLLPAARGGEPQLRGTLTVKLEGGVSTMDPSRVLQAVSGRGNLKVADPKIVNFNVLRAVFQELSMLPGLVQALETRLPPEYQAKLAANDTGLSPIDLSAQLQNGVLRCEEFEVSSDTFRIAGSGTIGLDGTVNVRSTLRIEPLLSTALIQSVNELQYLTNAAGEFEIPLTIQGQAPRFAVLPDLGYVASKLIPAKAADVIGELLREGTAPDEAQPDEAAADLVGQLLRKALQPEAATERAPGP